MKEIREKNEQKDSFFFQRKQLRRGKIMKKYWLFMIFIFILGSLSACSIPNERTSQTQTLQYIEYASSFIDKQNVLNETFNTYFNDEEKMEKAHEFLKNTYIPAFLSFQKEAKDIYLPNKDIKDIHTLYIRILTKQLAVYRLYLSSLEQQNSDSFKEANNQRKEVNALLESYRKRLAAIAKQNHITLSEVDS
jgi:hypothetical protein